MLDPLGLLKFYLSGVRDFSTYLYGIFGIGLLTLLFALFKSHWIKKQEVGTEAMAEIARSIRQGAMVFLGREYRSLAIFVLVVASLLYWINIDRPEGSPWIVLSFATGALGSALAGFFGMRMATHAEVRTAQAARSSLRQALAIAFNGGTVMGMGVVGLALLGLSGLLFAYSFGTQWELTRIVMVISGFSLGASSVAFFARMGGSVGDKGGDGAAMGADRFESYVGAIVAAMVLGAVSNVPQQAVLLPLALAAVGILCSILGTVLVRTREGGNPQTALTFGTLGASILMVGAGYFLIENLLPKGIGFDGSSYAPQGVFYAAIVGLACGIGIGLVSGYYCSKNRGPVDSIIEASSTGPASNIIGGLVVGMSSTFLPILFICIAVLISYEYAGLYGIAIAALGMLSTTGIQLAVDTYGPIADNAGRIAQMSDLPKEARARTDTLNAAGDTTTAIGEGFAIGAAALVALALISAFRSIAGISAIDLTQPNILAGLFLGAMLPFLFSSLAMKPFKYIPGLMAVWIPILIGFYDKEMLAGLLIGVTASGVPLALFMANAGGAWDNAKKQIEEEPNSIEEGTGKGSERHKAAVIGDTVGDPFKDTAGPSLNILIKLMSVVALVIAPLL